MSELKLFSVTHKELTRTASDRILVGVGNRQIPNVDFYDNNGDNITEKNANYCELTALYWIWKNVDADYIGLEHYRRYFCRKNIFKAVVLTKKKIIKILNKYDVILPRKGDLKQSVYEDYSQMHFASDLDICRAIIELEFPEFLGDFDAVMNMHCISACNMFIMSEVLMSEYCQWLFKILFAAEQQIDLTGRNVYQSRVFGFLSERLFNVWLHHKQLKVYYAPIYNVGDKPLLDKIKNKMNSIFHR